VLLPSSSPDEGSSKKTRNVGKLLPDYTAQQPRNRALIALMMEAAITSETSVNFYQTTRCNSP
jgi:hypothetical protein